MPSSLSVVEISAIANYFKIILISSIQIRVRDKIEKKNTLDF